MNTKMVSVVMITYGHDQFIYQAIEGVLMQKCDFEIELIIANDCSPDNTDNVVEGILQRHPNANWIKYTKHSENKGMMSNFIWALQQAKGKYIALCEGDDYWTDPFKLKKQVNFLDDNNQYNLVTSNAKIHDRFGEKVYNDVNTDFSFNFKKQIKKNCCVTCTTMFRNNQFDVIDNDKLYDLKIGDIIIWSLLLRNNKKGYFINENLATYRIHLGGIYSQNNLKENTINELNVYCFLLRSRFFNFQEKKILKYRIQLIWYDILYSRNWHKVEISFFNVLRYANILSFNSIVLTLKSFIRFFSKKNSF